MPENAWAQFNRTRPNRREKDAETITSLRTQLRSCHAAQEPLRRVAVLAGHVLDFLDEKGVGDWPSPARLRNALNRLYDDQAADAQEG